MNVQNFFKLAWKSALIGTSLLASLALVSCGDDDDDSPSGGGGGSAAVEIKKQWVFPSEAGVDFANPAAIVPEDGSTQYSVVGVNGVNDVLVKPGTGTNDVREDVFEEVAQGPTALTPEAMAHVSYIITKTVGGDDNGTYNRYDKVMWTGDTKFKIGTADVELYFFCQTAVRFAADTLLKPENGVLVGAAWAGLAYPAAAADPAALAENACRVADADATASPATVDAIGRDIGDEDTGWSYLLERATQVNTGGVGRGAYTWSQITNDPADSAETPGSGTTLTITGNVAAYSETVAEGSTADNFDGIVLSSAAISGTNAGTISAHAVVIARLKATDAGALTGVTYDAFGLGIGAGTPAATFICRALKNVAAAHTVPFGTESPAGDATSFLGTTAGVYGLVPTAADESDNATTGANPAISTTPTMGCPTNNDGTVGATSNWQLYTAPTAPTP